MDGMEDGTDEYTEEQTKMMEIKADLEQLDIDIL